jgi:hypothetical protein
MIQQLPIIKGFGARIPIAPRVFFVALNLGDLAVFHRGDDAVIARTRREWTNCPDLVNASINTHWYFSSISSLNLCGKLIELVLCEARQLKESIIGFPLGFHKMWEVALNTEPLLFGKRIDFPCQVVFFSYLQLVEAK